MDVRINFDDSSFVAGMHRTAKAVRILTNTVRRREAQQAHPIDRVVACDEGPFLWGGDYA